MKGISRQVIGFVVGAIFLVIVILIFAYFLSGMGSLAIRYNNIQYFHWFEGGLSSAWSQNDWVDTAGKELKNDGNKNYYVILVPNYTAKIINDTIKNRKLVSESLYTCINDNSLCMCLIDVDGSCFNSGLIYQSSNNMEDWNTTLVSCLNSYTDSFEVVECKNLLLSGFYYKDDDGNIKFPKILNDSTGNQIFGIGSDYHGGFEMHKKGDEKEVNVTEATS